MSSLRVTHEIHKTFALIKLDGHFDSYSSESDTNLIRNAYELICKETGQKDLILEFNIKHIGSIGINTLIKAYQIASLNDGRLIFIQFPDSEIRFLEITGFHRFVTCLRNRSELF